jgi:predicted O-linked N-acetylglucosamine transferase (SPINDLY family)
MSAHALQKIQELFQQGNEAYRQGQLTQAILHYRAALAINTDIPEVLANLAAALQAVGETNAAYETIQHCLRLKPDYADALNTLGNIYKTAGDQDKAAQAFVDACRAKPTHLSAWLNLGQILHQMKNLSGAAAAYRMALALDPHQIKALGDMVSILHELCWWVELPPLTKRLHQAIEQGVPTDPFVATLYAPELALENAKRYTAKRYPQGKAYDAQAALPSLARGDGKLRIGYLSADFNRHATAHLMSELFERHDRSRFEVYAYSHGVDDGSESRKRIEKGADFFYDTASHDDVTAAKQIQRDGIDILVDLKGYTHGHRQGIMALRPAPIQIHYLGYPGTSGAPFIDYFIADTVTVPHGSESAFSEKIIRVSHSYQINDRKRQLPGQSKPRAAYGLPENGFVFCAFNQSFKFTPEMFGVWMRLMAATDRSVLWLYESYTEASEHLKQEAKARGIDPARIVIAAKTTPEEHLARIAHADLFLDTYPCNAHTTASDMLWCGVPIVTLAGQDFISRVAASLLNAVGLSELVTHTLAEYEALALNLAHDKTRLGALRAHLQTGRMNFQLFDSNATTRALEEAYRQAAELFKQQKLPASFSVAEKGEIS